MTINEVIAKVDSFCPNNIDRKDKVDFLSTVERKIINEVMRQYDDVTYDKDFKRYDPERSGETELLAESPYDHLYIHYIMAQIYLILHEQEHYNNEIYIFNSIYDDYKVHMIQHHRPNYPSRYYVR
jgi:hypothetical protein